MSGMLSRPQKTQTLCLFHSSNLEIESIRKRALMDMVGTAQLPVAGAVVFALATEKSAE